MYHICIGDLSFLYDKYSNNNCSVEPFTQNPMNESSDVNSGLYRWTENAANINVNLSFSLINVLLISLRQTQVFI